MTLLRLESAALDRLYAVHLSLDEGLHVVVGTEADGAAELIELAAGASQPRRGRVEVDGRAPFASPAARRQIATLFRTEALSSDETVRRVIGRTLAVRGETNAQRVLAEYGFEAWAERTVPSLTPRERRTIALLMALSHDKARLLALFEPLAAVPELDLEQVQGCLERRARDGACVLVATASTEDALALGGRWLLLERGVLAGLSQNSEPPPLGAPSTRALSVRSGDPRGLAQALTAQAGISGLSFDDGHGSRDLLLFGPNPEALAEVVVSVARARGMSIEALRFVVPPLQALLAAKDGWARGAYERAYAAGYAAPSPRAAGGVYG